MKSHIFNPLEPQLQEIRIYLLRALLPIFREFYLFIYSFFRSFSFFPEIVLIMVVKNGLKGFREKFGPAGFQVSSPAVRRRRVFPL